MNDLFNQISHSISMTFFLRQLMVILVLFIVGFIVTASLSNFKIEGRNTAALVEISLLSFPVALAMFASMAYLMLVTGIPYTTATVTTIYLLAAALFAAIMIKRKAAGLLALKESLSSLAIILVVVVILACIACSGIMPISISNDSMYYFHEYPKDIVYFGHLRDQFDAFLTDTGLGAVSIETLPFLFGYNEGFGVREFMHINFVLYFTYEAYRVLKSVCSGRKCIAVSIVVGLILMTSSPVWILGHWAMANMYFMEFFFMGALGVYLYVKDHNFHIFVPAILCIISSLVRIEGGIFVVLLVACITLLDIDGLKLSGYIILPIFLLTLGYTAKIFMFYKFDNIYVFMNPVKAAAQAVAFLLISCYVLLIKKRLPEKIRSFMPHLMLTGFVGMNLLLLVYKSDLYIANLKAFYLNLTRQSGWGMLPVLSFGAAIIIVVFKVLYAFKDRNKACGLKLGANEESIGRMYFFVLTLGFVLVTLAVSFMRGDPLSEQVGDSGNRVLLQIAPLVIYTLLIYFVDLYERIREE